MTNATMTQPQREFDAILAAYNDATERLKGAHETLTHEVVRLRDELAAKNRELARRERLAALGQLAAGLAHEVRNPLGGILLYASMLERDLPDRPREREVAGKISRGVRSLERLVSEILEFAQEHVVERQWIGFDELIEPVLDGITACIDGRDVQVVVSARASEMDLYCDADRMRRALLNILLNAVQAVDGKGRIGVAACPNAAGGVRLEVWDSGTGICDDRIERIFDPFYTTRAGGTGLGLAIVHRIVEAHGGSIRARNRSEGGMQFVIELPGEPAASSGTNRETEPRAATPWAEPMTNRLAS